MPAKFWKRGIFHHSLYIYQRFFLWLKREELKLNAFQRKAFARCSHVQLDLGASPDNDNAHIFLNVTWPHSKFELYDDDRLHGEKWQVYAPPLFHTSPEQHIRLKDFAKNLISTRFKKSYDWLQLFSYLVNMLIWIMHPCAWGKEIHPLFNIPGGKHVCSSGAAACLRYSRGVTGRISNFFYKYDATMVPPVLFLLDQKWEIPGELYEVNPD